MAVIPSAKARQKHSIGRGGVLVIAAVAGLGGLLWAPSDAEATILYLTYQVPSTFAGTKFDYGDIVKYDTVTGQSSLYFKADDHFIGAEGHAMDALEVLPDGTILFSGVGGGRLPGIPNKFNYSDLIHYDPVNRLGTIVMAGKDHFQTKAGKPTIEQLDVVDVLPDGSFLFSTRYEAIFDGHLFDQDDVFRYDPVSGVVELFFDGGILQAGRQGFNLDGFDIMLDGRYLISIFKTRKLIDGLQISGSDLVIYDPATGHLEMFLDHESIPDWKGKHRNFTGIDTESPPPPPPLIPEPISSTLFGLGLLGVGMQRRSNKRARMTTTCCDKSTLSTS